MASCLTCTAPCAAPVRRLGVFKQVCTRIFPLEYLSAPVGAHTVGGPNALCVPLTLWRPRVTLAQVGWGHYLELHTIIAAACREFGVRCGTQQPTRRRRLRWRRVCVRGRSRRPEARMRVWCPTPVCNTLPFNVLQREERTPTPRLFLAPQGNFPPFPLNITNQLLCGAATRRGRRSARRCARTTRTCATSTRARRPRRAAHPPRAALL